MEYRGDGDGAHMVDYLLFFYYSEFYIWFGFGLGWILFQTCGWKIISSNKFSSDELHWEYNFLKRWSDKLYYWFRQMVKVQHMIFLFSLLNFVKM